MSAILSCSKKQTNGNRALHKDSLPKRTNKNPNTNHKFENVFCFWIRSAILRINKKQRLFT